MRKTLRKQVESLQIWAATVLYGWACRLAGRRLAEPWTPQAPEAFARLQAERMERIAREWEQRYRQLRQRGQEKQRPAVRVEF
jgi:hypothetical protein